MKLKENPSKTQGIKRRKKANPISQLTKQKNTKE